MHTILAKAESVSLLREPETMKRLHLTSTLAAGLAFIMMSGRQGWSSRAQHEQVKPGPVNQWTIFSPPEGRPFRDFQFLNETQGWAVSDHQIWKTVDGGRSWTDARAAPKVKLLRNYEPQETMEGVSLVSPIGAWVVEGSYLVHTTDGGASWEKQEFEHVIVRSCRFADHNSGWFVGQKMRLPQTKEEVETWYPVVYGTKDGGKSWRRLFTGPENPYPLWDVWPVSSTEVWAVGVSILHTTDAGKTWAEVHVDSRPEVSGMPSSVHFLDSNYGWITTNQAEGGYWFTSDGGKTWDVRGEATPDGWAFGEVVYSSPSDVWAVSGGVFHSDDGGKTWAKVLNGDYSRIQYLKDQRVLFATGHELARYKLP